MLPGGGAAPRGGGKRNAVYRSYYFLPQYFRRVVKVSAVAWPSTPFQPQRPTPTTLGRRSGTTATGHSRWEWPSRVAHFHADSHATHTGKEIRPGMDRPGPSPS